MKNTYSFLVKKKFAKTTAELEQELAHATYNYENAPDEKYRKSMRMVMNATRYVLSKRYAPQR